MTIDRCSSWLIAAAIVCTGWLDVHAQVSHTNLSDDALSRGAEAYANGNRAEAVRLLADAIQTDPHDPRPYYLRALCLAHAGRSDDARADLVVAAALEARSPDKYPVAEALAKLVPYDRTLLNQYRWRTQTEDVALAFDRGLMSFDERPEPAVHTDAGVLRQHFALPLGRLAHSITLAELADASSQPGANVAIETGSNPFADDSTPGANAADHTTAKERPLAAPANRAKTVTQAQRAPDAPDADPFAGTESAAAGKMPSGTLFGILRRAVTRAAPLPSLEGVRNQLPDLPLPALSNQPPAGAVPFDSETLGDTEVQPAAFTDDDPFGTAPAETAAPDSDEQPSAGEDRSDSESDEDPFG